ncbi:MAG: hypothetical protein RH859_06955 [Longimicrobiales bacterium]
MIELQRDALRVSFPDVHPDARLTISFQRTLRIPDDGVDYPLPPGLGRFPLRHVDDFADRIPERWLQHGGVMLPMYQAEALWLNFSSDYPFAVKVATGKINAVSGEEWREGLHRDPQDYLSVPEQPWLDGYCVGPGRIRQFVAMPLGQGYTVEEQVTGAAEHGGLQLMVHPLKADRWRDASRWRACDGVHEFACLSAEMGLAPGGTMRQQIYEDSYELADWDLRSRSRCFVHLLSAPAWTEATGSLPPGEPPSARDYTRAGLPWFDYYGADARVLDAQAALREVRSVDALKKSKGEAPLPGGASTTPSTVVDLGPTRRRVREW